MIKKLLSSLFFLLSVVFVHSATVTFTPTGSHTSEGDWTLSQDEITVSWHGADYSTDIRVYKGRTLTITSSGGNITQLDFTYSGSDNGGWDASYTNLSTKSWSKITSSGKSGKQAKITQLIVTYEGETPEYVVNWIANSDTIYKDTVLYNSRVDSIPVINIDNYCDDVLVGWTNSSYDGSTPPDVIFTTSKPTITKDTTFYAVFGNYQNGNVTAYFKTDLNRLTSEDVFVIVGEKNGVYYALSNDNGTSKAPDAQIVTPVNDYISSPADSILWKLVGNNEDGYTFYSYADLNKHLYCINDNNGLRVGNPKPVNPDSVFIVKNNYLYNNGKSRYVGVYTVNPDWRSYTSINANITGQTFEFYKGTKTIDEYHTETSCIREFNDTQNDGLWTTKENWSNNKIPTKKYAAQINKPVIVDSTHSVAKYIIINQNTGTGKITIGSNKGLEVDSTIIVYKNNQYDSTTSEDLVLESSESGNASLIFNNNNESQATVCLYSKAYHGEHRNWQYIGTTMTSLNALYNYYGSWIYKWIGGDSRWEAVPNGGTMYAWNGYCITQETPEWYSTSGTLVPTDTEDKTLVISAGPTVFANSWTAPIHIGNFKDEDFDISDKTIYFFNTGYDPDGTGVSGTAPGTYVSVPINAAVFLDKDSLIPSQQGVFVKSKTDGTITLKYKDLVRTNSKEIVAGPMRAPRHILRPNVLKIYATGSNFKDRLTILEREDFSTEFDNGWDGEKMSCSEVSPSIYVNSNGTYEVSAIPDYEGAVLGFVGNDSVCTFTFSYTGSDEWYLNDLCEQRSVLISDEANYVLNQMTSNESRFVISKTPIQPSTPTGLDEVKMSSFKKIVLNNQVYIINNGQIFDIIGQRVK